MPFEEPETGHVPPVLGVDVPPPLPGSAAAGPDGGASPALGNRLHPLSILFIGWNFVQNFLIPLIVMVLAGNEMVLVGFLLLFGPLSVGRPLFQYFTLRYQLTDEDLVIRQGVFEKTERHIPLGRVQDIRLEQGVLHRLLRMAVVEVETAGGQTAEAALSVVSFPEAERLRQAIFARKQVLSSLAEPSTAAPEPAAREVLHKLSTRELVLAGITSNRMVTVLALIASAWAFVDDVLPRQVYERLALWLSDAGERLFSQGTHTTIILVLLGLVIVVAASMVMSVIGSVVLFHGFTLSRSGEDLHRSCYGDCQASSRGLMHGVRVGVEGSE